ncbi:hypothetical protein N9Z83_01150, partial [Akkermansiaceae bacterium]|nr:hypothetical protein [Akkermansiaceae bacterium]
LKKRIQDKWSLSSIALQYPDAAVLPVPNHREDADSVRTFEKLKIELQEADETFLIEEDGLNLKLSLPLCRVPDFLGGINDIERGEGDYALKGEGEESLWFWWQVEK